MLLVIGVLLGCGLTYVEYRKSTEIMSILLGPATVALAVPLYLNLRRIRQLFWPIFYYAGGGGVLAYRPVHLAGWWFGAEHMVLMTMAPKSVTSPIAMLVAEQIGGVAALAAVFVLITGVIGAMIGPAFLSYLGVHTPECAGHGPGHDRPRGRHLGGLAGKRGVRRLCGIGDEFDGRGHGQYSCHWPCLWRFKSGLRNAYESGAVPSQYCAVSRLHPRPAAVRGALPGYDQSLYEKGRRLWCGVHPRWPGSRPRAGRLCIDGVRSADSGFQAAGQWPAGDPCRGWAQVSVREAQVQRDQLLVADVEWLQEQPERPLDEEDADLLALLQALAEHPMVASLDMGADVHGQQELGNRLAYLLPFTDADKIELLQLDDPVLRLDAIQVLLDELQGELFA